MSDMDRTESLPDLSALGRFQQEEAALKRILEERRKEYEETKAILEAYEV